MTSRIFARREFLRTMACAGGAFALAGCRTGPATPMERPARPNIVLILADDLGYGDPTCYNEHSKIPTPEIDKLAQEGIRFADAHSPSAVCTPTRYGLLTGRYCWRSALRSGVLNGYSQPLIETDRLTVASLLRQHGYQTGGVGKWHLGLGWVLKDAAKKAQADNVDYSKPVTHGPSSLGFDYSYIIPASLDMDPYCWLRNGQVVEAPTGHTPGSARRWSGGGGYWRAGAVAPSFDFYEVLPTITAQTVDFVKRQTPADPFFLYAALTAPHTPWMPVKEFRGTSRADWYGDFVAQVDWSVGQIVRAVDNAGLRDNTLVIVTSDNGSHWPVEQMEKFQHRANGPWRGQKADIHEGGHRVPFLCRWPGRIKPGTQSHQTICLTDLLATCAALAGGPLPPEAGPDSYNLLPALENPDLAKPLREATILHSMAGMFAVRQGPWKLIQGLGSGGFTAPREVRPKPGAPRGQLYHLAEDPGEQKNLWAEHPEIVQHLAAVLERYRQQGYSRPM